jgi:hypothetical protein
MMKIHTRDELRSEEGGEGLDQILLQIDSILA